MIRFALLAILSLNILAQTPSITSVVSSADLRPGVAAGSFGTIFGSNLSDAEYLYSTVPYPTILGGIELRFCRGTGSQRAPWNQCLIAGLVYVSPVQVNFRMPISPVSEEPIGVIVTRRNNIETQSPPVLLSRFDPHVFRLGFDCNYDARVNGSGPCGFRFNKTSENDAIRAAVTDLSGNLITSKNPLRLNQWYTVWLTGVGPFLPSGAPAKPISMTIDNIPGFPGNTFKYSFYPDWIGQVPQYPGEELMNIKLSIPIGRPLFSTSTLYPCGPDGNQLDLSMAISGFDLIANYNLPVLILPGDAACQ